ncbi:MAG: MFS transporter [Ancalomicrobiaceae bacterium]|nr:MFS transporter [Ancalomicrobiaceae bacterium]
MTIAVNSTAAPASVSDKARYFQFALLLLAAGAIYPLLYLRQNFEHTLLLGFNITSKDLGDFNSILGLIYVSTYIPSGWLADRFSPKKLIVFSVGAVGLLGLWYSTFPGYYAQMTIFIGWGLCAGLTFWASLIKSVNLLGGKDEQGRFFGVLDGGRGLVEAVLASAAVAIFAYYMGTGSDEQLGIQGFKVVIYMYSAACIAIALLVALFLDNEIVSANDAVDPAVANENIVRRTWDDLVIIFSIPQVWVMMLILLCGYMQFWATYSVSSFLQEHYKETAVVAAFITMTKLWMRPIGGVGGGFLADWLSRPAVLGSAMVLASLALFGFTYFPANAGAFILLLFVIVLGISTYAIRGLYWSILDDCRIPTRAVGLGIGVISMVGYTPDIFLPQINAALVAAYPGVAGAQYYFDFIAICGLIGAVAAFTFRPRKPKAN